VGAFELAPESYSKTVEFMPDGSRKVSLSPQTVELLENQLVLFREKFGRDPGPKDRIRPAKRVWRERAWRDRKGA